MAVLRKKEPQNEVYQLLQAHIYLIGNKVEEAKWILENYNYNRFAIGKDPVTNCYYLYLTAQIRGRETMLTGCLTRLGRPICGIRIPGPSLHDPVSGSAV